MMGGSESTWVGREGVEPPAAPGQPHASSLEHSAAPARPGGINCKTPRKLLRHPSDSTCSGAASGLSPLPPAWPRRPHAQAVDVAHPEVGIHFRQSLVGRPLL